MSKFNQLGVTLARLIRSHPGSTNQEPVCVDPWRGSPVITSGGGLLAVQNRICVWNLMRWWWAGAGWALVWLVCHALRTLSSHKTFSSNIGLSVWRAQHSNGVQGPASLVWSPTQAQSAPNYRRDWVHSCRASLVLRCLFRCCSLQTLDKLNKYSSVQK